MATALKRKTKNPKATTITTADVDPYRTFLANKTRIPTPIGITDATLPEFLFPFQRDLVAWALRRARAAIFANTGLGKTGMQLSWADIVHRHTGRNILVLTPLAVAQQTIKEALHFGIDGVDYAASQDDASTRIVVTNYDRLHKFDISQFGGIVLDESGCIKSHDSKTRAHLIETCVNVPFKLCCTATPAPNDFTELGGHSEFLNVLSEKEMLATFFVHDGSTRAHGAQEWRLKSHAIEAFWEWVSSWGVMVKSPSDLGYDDARYTLPPLIKHQITVPVEYAPSDGMLFQLEARTLTERLGARRDSVAVRCQWAADLVNAAPDRPWLVWCHLNTEADALMGMIHGAAEVRGPDSAESKTEKLLGFCNSNPRVLITKPKIAGHGLNWQHCHDMVFVGLSDSFEQVYQCIRRCWRFGQTETVNVYMIASELEGAVVANLEAKEKAFETMAEGMSIHLHELVRKSVQGEDLLKVAATEKTMELPRWL